jgi:hypothetical protein
MKKYLVALSLCFALCCISIAGYCSDVNEKVLKTFKATFPNAQNVTWQTVSERYTAQFKQNGIQTIVNYDYEGNLLSAIRYYSEDNLPINLIVTLKNKYPSKKIFGVTEVSTNDTIDYFVKLQDNTTWMTVKSDAEGNTEVIEKFNKQL